jgi:hypothetical protein
MRFSVGAFASVFGVVCLAGCPQETPPADDAGDAGSDAGDASAATCETSGCADPMRPLCDSSSGDCVECLGAPDCSVATEPLCAAGACTGCITDTACMRDTGRARCRSDGACVTCLAATDCPPATPFCTAEGTCAECRTDAECTDLAPACDASGTCASCLTSTCSDAQIAREVLARECADAALAEGDGALFDDVEALLCSGRSELFPLLQYLQDAIADGRVDVDLAVLAACTEGQPLFDMNCPGALTATVANGGTCGLDLECLSGRCSSASDDACSGRCEALGTDGDLCDDGSECESLLACVSGVCRTPVAVGASCTTLPCVQGATCVAGTCQALPGLDAACTGSCQAGLVCVGSPRRCRMPGAEGAVCRGDAFDGDCTEGLRCVSNRCALPPGDGQPCLDRFIGYVCADGLRCGSTVTCRVPSAVGATCTETSDCIPGARCVDGTCSDVLDLGAACVSTSACPLGTGCRDGRCLPLPDVGEACFSDGCLRGVCRSGMCQPLGALMSCTEGSYNFDLLDPCGASASCTETGGGWICVPESAPGAACGAADDPVCRPPTFCTSVRVCSPVCTAP